MHPLYRHVLVACGSLVLIALVLTVALVAVRQDSHAGMHQKQAGHRPFAASSADEPVGSQYSMGGLRPDGAATMDARAAVDQALALTDAATRLAALREALPEFLSQDPEAAAEWLRQKSPELSPEILMAVLRELAGFEPRLAIELARGANEEARRAAMREVQVVWAATDPAASAQAFLREPGADDGGVEIARLWAQQDPASAFSFANALQSTAARHEALAAVVESWAVSDPAAAARAVASLPPSLSRLPLVDRVAVEWATKDPRAALDWAEALPRVRERAAATRTVLAVSDSNAPDRAGKP